MKSKLFKLIVLGLSCGLWLFFGCNKIEDQITDVPKVLSENFVISSKSFLRTELSDIDRIKIALAKSLSNLIMNNQEVTTSSITSLIQSRNGNRILAYDFSTTTLGGSSLLQLLIDNIDSEDADIQVDIEDICKKYPHLSIGFPLWVSKIPIEVINNSEFVLFPSIRSRIEVNWEGIRLSDGAMVSQSKGMPYEYIPIQIKEAEDVIPYHESDLTTIWGDHLIEDHFPIVKNCEDVLTTISEFSISSLCNDEFKLLKIIEFRNNLRNACFMPPVEDCFNGIDDDGDGLVDGDDPDCDGVIADQEICNNGIDDDGDGLIDEDDPDCPCEPDCERDCVYEKNVIEGIKFANISVFDGLNNQPGGEDNISLHYVFVSSQMCGDPMVSTNCPPATWKKVFYGNFFDFFEIQQINGIPTQSELSDVIFIHPFVDIYWKVFPIYYDIPNDNSFEGIYSQLPYLNNTANSHFDGNVYGNVVTLSIHEHDNVIVKQTTTHKITVVNVAKVSLGLQLPGTGNTAKFEFSNTTTKTSEYKYEIEAEKDVELGQTSSIYCDQNYTNSTIGYGINKSTGSIITHLAFYYE